MAEIEPDVLKMPAAALQRIPDRRIREEAEREYAAKSARVGVAALL